ncbi:PH domain-containing protein [Ornithinimicrobium pratense]|uniref:PH domain-containing protein n=1 Tax=Ornithinimicrobium pratense TaxID=2593973 RepID=A0A5J6V586_9MICO|nr:PH domain-containing protein [Ornithinimicrobium pratense]QFG68474.1 PH domain-containing protein [Ornithinimicrobium pratense]
MTDETLPAGSRTAPEPSADGWRGLSIRVVWVDFAKSLLSVLPAVVAILGFGIEPSWSSMWPFAAIAVWGVLSAVADIIRWLLTRYRITETEVERSTGLFVRRHRSVRRDRIRSVDTHAKLRHRIAGLRVITVGAGQQTNAGEAAFVLDSLIRDDAELLRSVLLREHQTATAETERPRDGDDIQDPPDPAKTRSAEVFATLRPWWVVYHMFSLWAYLSAAGLLWGAFWLASTFGVNLIDVSSRWISWGDLGWFETIAVAVVGGGLFGAIAMGVGFFLSYWKFELARVRSDDTSFLRTRRGLLSTREVNRDEVRTRGLSISEPLLWRWMRMADTNVITTGLSIWDPEQPSAILPRGPRSIAHEVATRVLGAPSPLEVPLPRHPRAALRRRLWWATAFTALGVAIVALPVATSVVPTWVLWAAIGVWPVALCGAIVAYRALGHAITEDYVVMRSGLTSRTTSALRRDAVSTIAVRQSILQKRLGLSTVSAMTAAGWSIYEAPDVCAHEAISFAAQAAPGFLDEFLGSSVCSRADEVASGPVRDL